MKKIGMPEETNKSEMKIKKEKEKEMNKKRNLPTMMMTTTQNRLGFIKE